MTVIPCYKTVPEELLVSALSSMASLCGACIKQMCHSRKYTYRLKKGLLKIQRGGNPKSVEGGGGGRGISKGKVLNESMNQN